MKLYTELAEWWPLVSPPADDYAKEAELAYDLLARACDAPPRRVLELGSGGGNNARFLLRHFEMTLVDLSPRMLAVSRALNPGAEHLEGDMRSLRLGRLFDAVFVQDAVCYMTTRADLLAAMRTARVHCRPGGAALFMPDFVAEIYEPRHEMGGSDAPDGRGARYAEWCHPARGETVAVDYAFLLRDERGDVRVVHDRHVEGLFARAVWLELLGEAGFEPEAVGDPWGRLAFVARVRA